MDKNPTLKKEIIEAWERYLNKTNTRDDFELILELFRDDRLQEFNEVADSKWVQVMNELHPTPEEKERYRREFARFFAEYQKRQKIEQRRIFSRNSIVRFRKIRYAAAAILLGLLIPDAAYLYMKPKTEQIAVQYVEELTQRGEIKTVVLPDQTEVTLNSDSRIIYPDHFVGNERSVELYGEALFDVTSNPARPFTVKTESLSIKVIGTVFDVKEYADDLVTSVSVVSGKVEVGLADEKLMLGQNQQVKMDKATGDFEKLTVDADKYLSWTDGALYFYRTPIREVVNVLNRKFPQVDIELAEGEYYYLITGEHDNVCRAENIIKGIIYSTGLKYKKTGANKYVLFNEETKNQK